MKSCSVGILHCKNTLLLRVEELSEVWNDKVDVFVWLWSLCGLHHQDSLCEQVEECFELVNSLFSYLEECPLFPEINNHIKISRNDVAHNSWINVFLLLQKLVSELSWNFLENCIILIGNDVCQRLFPCASRRSSNRLGDCINNGREIILRNCMNHLFNKQVFLTVEVLLLNLLKQFFATCFCDEQCFRRSAALKSDLSCVFEFTDEETLFDDWFCSFIPVDVSGDRLLNNCLSRRIWWRWIDNWSFMSILVRLNRLSYFFLSKLREKVSSTFGSHRW